MAKITRKTQKIFADSAPTNQLTTFGTAMAVTPNNSRDLADIQNANFSSGWAAAVEADKAPYEEDTNGLFYLVTKQLAYIFQAGVSEWDSGTTYYINDYCRVGNVLYYSLQDNNTGKDPTSETAYWSQAINFLNWTNATGSNISLTSVTALGTYNIDLSGILPSDNYNYECLLKYTIERRDNNNNDTSYTLNVGTKTYLSTFVEGDASSSTNYHRTCGQAVVVITSTRSLTVIIGGDHALNNSQLELIMYRKCGI